ncbi:putative auxin efflux carrier component 6 [Sesbania bispinosa]|nr:putative auxin efflux carrier component 6 [Sesbania bispinosa]
MDQRPSSPSTCHISFPTVTTSFLRAPRVASLRLTSYAFYGAYSLQPTLGTSNFNHGNTMSL